MKLFGTLIDDPTWGRQIKVQSGHMEMSFSREGLISYLADEKRFKDIGPIRARALVDLIGVDNFDDTVCKNPGALTRVAGVTNEVADTLHKHWMLSREINAVVSAFRSYGLNQSQAIRVVHRLGQGAVALLELDPYRLIDLAGLSFQDVDKVEREKGIEKTDVRRIAGAAIYALKIAAAKNGDTAMTSVELAAKVRQYTGSPSAGGKIKEARDYRRNLGQPGFHLEGGQAILDKLFSAETAFVELLRRGETCASQLSRRCSVGDIAAPEELTTDQRLAFERCLVSSIVFVFGRAGTGKTFSAKLICDLYQQLGCTVQLMAPTGKAAKRLAESTGRNATTIHRALIETPKSVDVQTGEMEFQWRAEPLDCDLLLVDEMSMIDSELMGHLARCVNPERTSVIFLGDANQLVPVGPGQPAMDVYERLIQPRGGVAICRLHQIVRQTGKLARYCVDILEGTVRAQTDYPEGWVVRTTGGEREAVLRVFEEDWLRRYDHFSDVQVLTPMNKGPLGVDSLNVILQQHFQLQRYGVLPEDPGEDWKAKILPGDKVIQTRNNYNLGIFNGDTGIALEVVEDDDHEYKKGSIKVDFGLKDPVWLSKGGGASSKDETRDLKLAYAITVHKAQGSEYPVALVVCDRQHQGMLTNSWLYTAVTRGKRAVCLLGQSTTASRAAKTKYAFGGRARSTYLAEVL